MWTLTGATNETEIKPMGGAKMLKFSSTQNLSNVLAQLEESNMIENGGNVYAVLSRATDIPMEFVSLRDKLIQQCLREFNQAELAEINSKGLVYETEDSIISDPQMTSILNEDREVQIANKVYRYVDQGLVIYDAETLIYNENWITDINHSCMDHGDSYTIDVEDQVGSATFRKINYDPIYREIDLNYDIPVTNEPNNDDYIYSASIKLQDGITIPENRVKKITYAKGNGDAGFLGKFLSGLFGTNVVVDNYFDKRHRMRLRMFSQDYIIYRSTGMTVRMQERTLGIWWRKKAQEFRYGWSAIECKYTFNTPVFGIPYKLPSGQIKNPTYPIGIERSFPFAKSDIVLFSVPLINYDVTTGDVNRVLAMGLKSVAKNVQTWFADNRNSDKKDNPRGVYTLTNDDKTILAVFPQGEETASNSGREKVIWEHQWFSGNFTIGFKLNIGNMQFNPKNFSPNNNVEIQRGRIYAAVKYNNEWRACEISTR